MKIGIIKGLYYYEYGDLWTYFLNRLGHECITSENGESPFCECGDETCLPVKAYHKHAKWLLGAGVDCLFSPKIIKCGENSFTCPKVIGINDMLKASLHPRVRLVSPEFSGDFKSFFANAGLSLCADAREIREAAAETLLYRDAKITLVSPAKTKNTDGGCEYSVCLLGHKYIVGDSFINMDIKNRLKKLGIHSVTSNSFDNGFLSSSAQRSVKIAPFWITGRQALGLAALSESQAGEIDGYIYLSAFGCGPDSFIVPLTKKYIRDMSGKPFMEISFDEHTAGVGLDTRLEAFADMLKERVFV